MSKLTSPPTVHDDHVSSFRSYRQFKMESSEFLNMRSAILRNDVSQLQVLAKKGTLSDLALLGKALLFAAENGQDKCVQVLLDAGASPNTHTSRGGTPLIYAAKCGFEKVIRVLMNANCTMTRGMYGVRSTALHWAASMGNTDCVEALLEHEKVDPDAQTMHGLTALMLALRRGEEEMADILINAGADMLKRDDYGQSPLHHASVGGFTACLEPLLKKGVNVDVVDGKGNSAIILATKENNTDMVQHLIDLGANVKLKAGKSGLQALHWAAYYGHIACLEPLLDAGCDVDSRVQSLYSRGEIIFQEGATALHLSAQSGRGDVITALLLKKANVELLDSNFMTALHYAAKHDNPECLSLLLLAGVNPDSQASKYLPTPLSLAIRVNSIPCVKYLIRANCSLSLRVYKDTVVSSNLETMTPFQLAADCECVDIIKMLAMAGCDLSDLAFWVETGTIPLELQFNQDVLHWLLDIMSSPKSLKEFCRKEIRTCMGLRAMNRFEQLSLPVSLCRFINFAELDFV